MAVLAHAGLASAEPARPVATRMTLLPHVTTTFTCGRMSSQACHYLILNSLCQERMLADGGKERTCRYDEAVPPFQLKPGESRKITDLPADYVYLMKPGVPPTPEECIAAPMPH